MSHPLLSPARIGPIAAAPELLTVLALVILAASAARLLGLAHLPVWHDEAFTLIRAFGFGHDEVQSALFSGQLLTPEALLRFQLPDPERTWSDTVRALIEHPEHPPLYYLLARLATALPIAPLNAVRGVSALCGILLIPAVYWLTRELFGRGLTPWIAAALVACSPLQLLYAQEARQYALWLLLLVAASAALTRALRHDRATDWWRYGFLATLGLYTHLLFMPMLLAHALYGWLAYRSDAQRSRPFGRLARRWTIAMGVALLLFVPWLWVIASQPERIGNLTDWMRHPVSSGSLFMAWAEHCTRAFVDLTPHPTHWQSFLLLPLGWTLAYGIRHAPRPGIWLLLFMLLVYGGIALAPDLLLGGSRSLHVRYVLPALLAMQIIVAWVIGMALDASANSWRRRGGSIALALLIGGGGLSLLAIGRAETWSTKHFSASNGEIARIANAATAPAAGAATLVVAGNSGVATGELISLAYRLDSGVRLWGQPAARSSPVPAGFAQVIALTPTDRLRDALGRERTLTPLAGTWQWFAVAPSDTASAARQIP